MIHDGCIHDTGTTAVTHDTVNIVCKGTVGKGKDIDLAVPAVEYPAIAKIIESKSPLVDEQAILNLTISGSLWKHHPVLAAIGKGTSRDIDLCPHVFRSDDPAGRSHRWILTLTVKEDVLQFDITIIADHVAIDGPIQLGKGLNIGSLSFSLFSLKMQFPLVVFERALDVVGCIPP